MKFEILAKNKMIFETFNLHISEINKPEWKIFIITEYPVVKNFTTLYGTAYNVKL